MCLLANHVEVVASSDLLLCQSIEFAIVKAYLNSVVHINPSWFHIYFRAVLCVSKHEVGCLVEIMEQELLVDGIIFLRALLPLTRQLRKCGCARDLLTST